MVNNLTSIIGITIEELAPAYIDNAKKSIELDQRFIDAERKGMMDKLTSRDEVARRINEDIAVKKAERETWACKGAAVTLRDRLAMAALTGLCIGEEAKKHKAQMIANDAYELADAMLLARAKP